LVTLLYPIGAVTSGERAAPVVLAVVVVGLAAAVGLRLRAVTGGGRLADLGGALRPTWGEGAVLGGGALAGVLVLAPTMKQGFPTTIAVSNNDGWGYATLIDWLVEHPFPRDVAPNLAEPLTLVPWTTDRFNFGFGFERFAATLASLLDRQGYEVVNCAAAVALAAAVGGWAALAASLRPRLSPALMALVVVAVASPVLVLPFVENYTTQFVSMCLWPFALAAFVLFAAAPGWRRLLVAAVAGGAVVGVYPAVSPWLVLPIVAIAVLLVPEAPDWPGRVLRSLNGAGLVRRIGRGAAVIAIFAVAVAVLSPIQVWRGVQNLLFLDDTPVNAIAGFYSDEAYAALFTGAASAFSLFSGAPLGWSTYAALAILAAAFALALWPSGRPRAPGVLGLAIVGGVLLTAGAILVRYRVMDQLPYQVYKGLMTGGALLGGLAVIGLLAGGGRRERGLRLAALGCVAAVWIPVVSQNLESSVQPGTGFRAADVEMGRALEDLPPGSTVLVEGSGADASSFQYRMMAAYFGDRAPELTAIGLGTTGTYLTPGNLPEWRPSRPWTHVLQSRAEPIVSKRPLLWKNAKYALSEAPALDVTTFGAGWYPPTAEPGVTYAQTAGPAELVLSNRGPETRRALLRMTVTSYGIPRTLTLTTEGGTVARRLVADVPTPVSAPVSVPGAATTLVTLDARPGTEVPRPGDSQPVVLRVEYLRVSGAGG
jgi:hypothetical protein